MASTLPTLCLHNIFEYLRNDPSSLYACALVNRHWWRHAISELWRDPFIVVKSKDCRAKLFDLLMLFLDDINSKSMNPT